MRVREREIAWGNDIKRKRETHLLGSPTKSGRSAYDHEQFVVFLFLFLFLWVSLHAESLETPDPRIHIPYFHATLIYILLQISFVCGAIQLYIQPLSLSLSLYMHDISHGLKEENSKGEKLKRKGAGQRLIIKERQSSLPKAS